MGARKFRFWISRVLLTAGLYTGTASAQHPTGYVFEDSVLADRVETGVHLVYDMRFDSAATIFAAITAANPDHPMGPFFQGLNVWWKIMVDLHDTSYDKQFNRLMQRVIDRSNALLEQNPKSVDGLFFKGLGLSFRGRLHSNRRHWIRSVRDARGAIKQVIKLAETDAENDDFYFGWGVYDYFSEVITDDHKILLPLALFFPNGDKDRGRKELQRTFDHGRFLRAEAAYFLFQIYTYHEPNLNKSLEYATWLRVRYPNNVVFRFIEGRAYARFGRWTEAHGIFQRELARWKAGTEGYNDALAEQALYYLARSRMGAGAYDDALRYLKELNDLAQRSKHDTAYKVLGLLRQGMAFDALGYRDYALYRYRQVSEMKDWSSSRKRARKYTKNPYVAPN